MCRSKNAGVAGYAEAFRPVQSDSQTSEWYSYFKNDVLETYMDQNGGVKMSETTEFKDVYEAIASVSPNRQNVLYTILEEDDFGEKAFFSDEKLIWESTKGGFFSQNQEEIRKLHDSGQAIAAGKKLFCDC